MSNARTDLADHLEFLRELWEETIPVYGYLGLTLGSLEDGKPIVKIEMKDELVGNYLHKNLHGGIVALFIDHIGGLTVAMEVMKKVGHLPEKEIKKRLLSMGTIDLRVDFLKPGIGKYFLATGSVLRMGEKIAVTRMELHNDQGVLIAVGAGSYMV